MEVRIPEASPSRQGRLVDAKVASKAMEDLTGRDRLVSSVLINWAAQFVFIVAGFIMPRVIDRRLGQNLLGIWDFSWSLVTYFSLIQMGVASSVNRYVARHRAAGEALGLNNTVSSAMCMLGIAALLMLGLTVAVTGWLPQLFGSGLGENVREAQLVVLLLGASLAVQTALGVFGGVLAGCHCWGLHNLNTSGWYAATVVGMILAVLLGGRLWILATITLVGEVLAGASRAVLAHRVCAGLRLRPSFVRWSTVKELFTFGAKTLIPSIANVLLDQTSSVLIMGYLGPAALALYSRPKSLTRQAEMLVRKMAMPLTPTVSSLEGMNDLGGVRELVIKSTRYSCYLALPIVLVLVVFGGAIMQLWMGPRYANGLVPAVLAIGYLAVLVQIPAWNILVGLNAHGRAGMARLVASLCAAGLNVLVLAGLKLGLVATAVAVTLPLTILNIVDIPLLVCRRTHLPARKYFVSVVTGPTLHLAPFALCLLVARMAFPTEPLTGLAWGGIIGGLILAVLYWRCVLPETIRAKTRAALRACLGG